MADEKGPLEKRVEESGVPVKDMTNSDNPYIKELAKRQVEKGAKDIMDDKLKEATKPGIISKVLGLGAAAAGIYFLGPLYSSLYSGILGTGLATTAAGYASSAALPGYPLYQIPQLISKGVKSKNMLNQLKAKEATYAGK